MPAVNCGHDRQRRGGSGTMGTIIALCLLDYNRISTPYSSLFTLPFSPTLAILHSFHTTA
jgi:hypothetical protein